MKMVRSNYKERRPAVSVSVPKGKVELVGEFWQFVVTVIINNFSAREVRFLIDGNEYGEPKAVSPSGHVNSLIREIPEKTRFVEIQANVIGIDPEENISGNYVLEIPKEKREPLYPDKIRFWATGSKGYYRIAVSLTDQKSNPLGDLMFRIIDKESGNYLAERGSGWKFQPEEFSFRFNHNGVLEKEPLIEVEAKKKLTLQLMPIDFRLPEDKLPEIDMEGRPPEEKGWQHDNNFWGYALFATTFILMSVTILFRLDRMWKWNAILIFASLVYFPYMFHDEVAEGIRQFKESFRKKEYYRDLEDRPKEGLKEQVKEVAKESVMGTFGTGLSQFLSAVFIEGIGHRLFGRRR